MITTASDRKFGTVLFDEFKGIRFPKYKNISLFSSIIPMIRIFTYISHFHTLHSQAFPATSKWTTTRPWPVD